MTSLATLTYKLENLCERIDNGDDIPEDLLAEFASAQMEHEQKVSAYVSVIDVMKRNAAYYSARAEILNRRAKTCERVEKAIKDRLVYQIDSNPDLPWKSLEGDKLRAQKNNESLTIDVPLDKRYISNVLTDISDVELEFVTVSKFYCVNTEAVKNYLKTGKTLNWARLESKGKHLRIS